EADVPRLAPEMTAREAASALLRSGAGRLPVVEEGRLIGMITCLDILPEVSRSFDPHTGLPWSASLREWAIDQLMSGQEITVLFVDLNRFGQFNKRYGHLVGDEVLRLAAGALLDATDPELDYVCRYGGDEFCIASLRAVDSAADLA